MLPTVKTAMEELRIAGEMNPGPWTEHSCNVGEAARRIAEATGVLDAGKAHVLGLLHDIGRRTGVAQLRHVIDGYDYAMSRGWEEVARVCLTHSYPVKDIAADIARRDVTPEQYEFIRRYLTEVEYDDYDRLIILCDALADANGFCILEKRFVDVTRRYGLHPFTLERWNNTLAIKAHFEQMTGGPLYALLPGIERCIYT